MVKKVKKSAGIFALYAGERNIADGTLEEISRQTGRSLDSLRRYLTPSYLKEARNWKNALCLVKLYDEGEKEE